MQTFDDKDPPRWIESAGNFILAALLASVLMGALQPLISGRESASNGSCVGGERLPCNNEHLHLSAAPARNN